MFIDIHTHTYRYQYPNADGSLLFLTPEQVLEKHNQAAIERAVLLPIVSPEVYVPQSVGEIIEIARNSDGRFIPFCNVDPRALTNTAEAPLDILLEHYREQGCRGIGEVMPNLEFLDPRMQNLFKHVERIGFPLIFDLTGRQGSGYGLYDEPGLPQLEECLRRFPGLTFVGHGPAFWAEIGILKSPEDRFGYPDYPIQEEGTVPRLMRDYDNLWAELSAGSGANAMMRDPGYAVDFIHEFQDRLLFGTDICTLKQQPYTADFLLSLRSQKQISRKAFEKVAKNNAVKLLELKDH